MRAFWGLCFTACANSAVPADAPLASVPTAQVVRGQRALIDGGETVLWTALADLDGDGVPDRITLSSSELAPRSRGPHDAAWMNVLVEGACGESCTAYLRIGPVQRKVVLVLPRDDARGGLGISVTDLLATDGQRELLLHQQRVDDEISWAAVDVAIYRNGAIEYHELWGSTWPGNGSEVIVDGKGRLLLRFHSCARTTIVAYERERGGLRKVEDRIQVTGNLAKCSG